MDISNIGSKIFCEIFQKSNHPVQRLVIYLNYQALQQKLNFMNEQQIIIIIFFLHINTKIEKIFSYWLFFSKNRRSLHFWIQNFLCINDIRKNLARSILILNVIVKLKISDLDLHDLIFIVFNLKKFNFLDISQHELASLVLLVFGNERNLHNTNVNLQFDFSLNIHVYILQR